MKRTHGWMIYLTVTFVLLGIMLSLQVQTHYRLSSDLAAQSTSELTIMLKNLSDKRLQLNQEIMKAEENLAAYQNTYEDDTEMISRMQTQISRLEMLTGSVDVTGPGIKVIIEKHNLLYSDVVSLINELWGAGAEAVAINNQRITATSAIGYVEALNTVYITYNNHILDAPYVITAIGDGGTLEKGLTMPGGIIDNLAFFKIFPTITIEESVTIPALAEQMEFRFSKVPEK